MQRSLFALCATLALLIGCGAPSHATKAPTKAPGAQPETVQAPSAQPAGPAVVAPEPNRDPHGNRDVGAYISTLEGDKRVIEMRPDFVVEQLALPADAVVADLGCGPGVFAVRFARACPKGIVYAADIEPRQLDRLREHLLAENITNVVPVLASPTTPHFPPGRCDVVFIGDTYHHLSERVEYMQRLRSVFSERGQLVIFEYKPGQLAVGPPPEHKLQAGVLESELKAAGYELVRDFKSHEYHDFQIWKPAR